MAGTTAAHRISHPASARLLLDEMFSPAIAAALRDLGRDVIAVAERGELRAMSDDDVFAWATSQRRWLHRERQRLPAHPPTSTTGRHRHHGNSLHQQPRLPALKEEPWAPDPGHPCLDAQRATGGTTHRGLAPQPDKSLILRNRQRNRFPGGLLRGSRDTRAAGGVPRRCPGARRRSAGDGSRTAYQDPCGSPAAVPSVPLPPGLLQPASEACPCH